ncbi:unnamed protein product [Miscanthus lutarioriparius]|uniref:Uncharacterized protein n=1 Tax=Miscanthus lutarioriparius TaxID=422564 RepID=A0A811RL01_9POAL|nr:unnamed protein product [Miscanthus lutarioriparius]
MAGIPSGEGSGDARDRSIPVSELFTPFPSSVTKFFCEYDLDLIGEMWSGLSDLPFDEGLEAHGKLLDDGKKPVCAEEQHQVYSECHLLLSRRRLPPPVLPTLRQDIQAAELRGPLGRPPPGGCRIGLPGVLYWSSGDGGRSRLLAARARGRNRFSGGGRGTTKDEAAEEDEEQAIDVVIVDAGDDEEYASDEVSGFRGLVLDLSYRTWTERQCPLLCGCSLTSAAYFRNRHTSARLLFKQAIGILQQDFYASHRICVHRQSTQAEETSTTHLLKTANKHCK